MPTLSQNLKHRLRKVPFVLPLYKRVRRFLKPPRTYAFVRSELRSEMNATVRSKTKVLNLLDYTKTSGSGYPGMDFPAGYHELTIFGETVAGQRRPHDRLSKVPIDFTNKTVLDIGCNQGGMLFALREQVRWAVGVDFDYRMINACNAITNELAIDNTRFYVFDIDTDPHGLLQDFLPELRVDVVFLLAVCFWVKEWRALIDHVTTISDTLVFEANGDEASMAEQIAYVKTRYQSVTLLSDHSAEDTKFRTRKLLLAETPKRNG